MEIQILNKEEVRERNRQWYKNLSIVEKQKIINRIREYNIKNKDKVILWKMKSKIKNRDKDREKSRLWKLKPENKEKIKIYNDNYKYKISINPDRRKEIINR